jgi:hypothetical protein
MDAWKHFGLRRVGACRAAARYAESEDVEDWRARAGGVIQSLDVPLASDGSRGCSLDAAGPERVVETLREEER